MFEMMSRRIPYVRLPYALFFCEFTRLGACGCPVSELLTGSRFHFSCLGVAEADDTPQSSGPDMGMVSKFILSYFAFFFGFTGKRIVFGLGIFPEC